MHRTEGERNETAHPNPTGDYPTHTHTQEKLRRWEFRDFGVSGFRDSPIHSDRRDGPIVRSCGALLQHNGPGKAPGPQRQSSNPIASAHFLTFTWKPASLRALTSSTASKSPVTSKVSTFGVAVSASTPLTFFTVALIALQQAPQQLWTSTSVIDFTLPAVAPLSSLTV